MNQEQKSLPEARQYCPTQTRRKVLEEGAILVDVRERAEVDQLAFDMPAIIHLPMSEFEARFEELPRDRELILVCSVGQRSLKATYFLMYHGFDQVANMEYGLKKWVYRGFPVIGDPTSLDGAGNDATGSANSCCS